MLADRGCERRDDLSHQPRGHRADRSPRSRNGARGAGRRRRPRPGPSRPRTPCARSSSRFGRLDALVNMASVFRRTPLATLSARDFDAMIAANLAAPYHTAVAAGAGDARAARRRRHQGEDRQHRRLGDRAPLQGLSALPGRQGGPDDDDPGPGRGAGPAHPGRHDPAGDDRPAPRPRPRTRSRPCSPRPRCADSARRPTSTG